MPRKRRTPPEKKELSLDKDTADPSRFGFRKTRPKLKAKSRRAYRQNVRRALIRDPSTEVLPREKSERRLKDLQERPLRLRDAIADRSKNERDKR